MVNLEEIKQYAEAGYKMLPLHKWDSKSENKKGVVKDDGKRPLHKNWTKRVYKPEDLIRMAKGGYNLGVQLRASDLVIDVDPRNMPEGEDTFKKFCEATGFPAKDYPCVFTGSGGAHYYCRKDPKVPIVTSLEGYPGVEFKTLGSQVVAAGSRHPNGKHYEFDFLGPRLKDVKEAPENVMTLIQRPAVAKLGGGDGGEYDEEQLTKMLDALDPEKFRNYDDWIQLAQACHHATAGAGRQAFIDWSTGDPEYQDEGWQIGRHWDSFHRERDGQGVVTYRTLQKILNDHGKSDAFIRPESAIGDFDGVDVELPEDDRFDDLPLHERKGPLERMNDVYCAVEYNGQFRIMYEKHDPELDQKIWVKMPKAAFIDYFSHRYIEIRDQKDPEKTTVAPIAKEWLNWGSRKTAKGVIFDPKKDHPGYLNLWSGWGVDPKPGDWSMIRELISILCSRDKVLEDFVIKWIAYMVQKPDEPAGVALCFHGAKGTGKSTLGYILAKLSGRHGKAVVAADHVTGRFNEHLRDAVFLFADEAVHPSDRDAQSRMKTLITGTMLAFEAKGVDASMGKSCLHVMMVSNHDWFVDASATDGERRYFVSEVASDRQNDIEWFRALHKQAYEEGGIEAMLHDMMLVDLGRWQPMGNVPKTSALADQKLRNLNPIGQWWLNVLDSGELPFPLVREDDWEQEAVRAFKSDVRETFDTFCAQNNIRPGSMNRSIQRFFWKEFKKYCPGLQSMQDVPPEDRDDLVAPPASGRLKSVRFPDLMTCREQFEDAIEAKVLWD